MGERNKNEEIYAFCSLNNWDGSTFIIYSSTYEYLLINILFLLLRKHIKEEKMGIGKLGKNSQATIMTVILPGLKIDKNQIMYRQVGSLDRATCELGETPIIICISNIN